MKKIRLIVWLLVVIAGAAVIMMMPTPSAQQATQEAAALLGTEPGRQSAVPGGPFSLTAHTGERVTDADFRGRYMLIFFGYTFCPDICPVEMDRISAALETLEQEGYDISPIQPLFITLDPKRDTVDALKDYAEAYHPAFLMLTGSDEEVSQAIESYRVYRKFQPAEDSDPDFYLVDHLWVDFLMDQEGSLERLFSNRDTLDDMTAYLRGLLEGQG